MKANHKRLGQIELIGQNEKHIFINVDGEKKSLMRLFAANMITEVVDFDSLPFMNDEPLLGISGQSSKKKDSKLAILMNEAHMDEKFNHLSGDWEKI